MPFSFVGGNSRRANGTAAGLTHGVAIQQGDLVCIYINRNDSVAITNDAGGFTEALQIVPPTQQTAAQAFYWKIAGASEPADYNFTLGGTSDFQICIMVFRPTGGAVQVALPATDGYLGTTSYDMVCSAHIGRTVPAGALSIICGGKDTNQSPTTWDSVDNGYQEIQGAGPFRSAAMAYKVPVSEETLGGNITFSTSQSNSADATYSMHIVFSIGATTSVANIDGDDDVYPGQTGVTVNLNGGSSITSIDSATLNGTALTNISYTGGASSFTCDIPESVAQGSPVDLVVNYSE